jgi:hypothetical protein
VPERNRLTAAAAAVVATRVRASAAETNPLSAGSAGYVAGNADFVARLCDASAPSRAPRLPGAEENLQYRLPMADPRQQGLAGAIRFVASRFFGAQDPHCIDVMRWLGMTTEERVAQHVGARDIAA